MADNNGGTNEQKNEQYEKAQRGLEERRNELSAQIQIAANGGAPDFDMTDAVRKAYLLNRMGIYVKQAGSRQEELSEELLSVMTDGKKFDEYTAEWGKNEKAAAVFGGTDNWRPRQMRENLSLDSTVGYLFSPNPAEKKTPEQIRQTVAAEGPAKQETFLNNFLFAAQSRVMSREQRRAQRELGAFTDGELAKRPAPAAAEKQPEPAPRQPEPAPKQPEPAPEQPKAEKQKEEPKEKLPAPRKLPNSKPMKIWENYADYQISSGKEKRNYNNLEDVRKAQHQAIVSSFMVDKIHDEEDYGAEYKAGTVEPMAKTLMANGSLTRLNGQTFSGDDDVGVLYAELGRGNVLYTAPDQSIHHLALTVNGDSMTFHRLETNREMLGDLLAKGCEEGLLTKEELAQRQKDFGLEVESPETRRNRQRAEQEQREREEDARREAQAAREEEREREKERSRKAEVGQENPVSDADFAIMDKLRALQGGEDAPAPVRYTPHTVNDGEALRWEAFQPLLIRPFTQNPQFPRIAMDWQKKETVYTAVKALMEEKQLTKLNGESFLPEGKKAEDGDVDLFLEELKTGNVILYESPETEAKTADVNSEFMLDDEDLDDGFGPLDEGTAIRSCRHLKMESGYLWDSADDLTEEQLTGLKTQYEQAQKEKQAAPEEKQPEPVTEEKQPEPEKKEETPEVMAHNQRMQRLAGKKMTVLTSAGKSSLSFAPDGGEGSRKMLADFAKAGASRLLYFDEQKKEFTLATFDQNGLLTGLNENLQSVGDFRNTLLTPEQKEMKENGDLEPTTLDYIGHFFKQIARVFGFGKEPSDLELKQQAKKTDDMIEAVFRSTPGADRTGKAAQEIARAEEKKKREAERKAAEAVPKEEREFQRAQKALGKRKAEIAEKLEKGAGEKQYLVREDLNKMFFIRKMENYLKENGKQADPDFVTMIREDKQFDTFYQYFFRQTLESKLFDSMHISDKQEDYANKTDPDKLLDQALAKKPIGAPCMTADAPRADAKYGKEFFENFADFRKHMPSREVKGAANEKTQTLNVRETKQEKVREA